MLTDILRQIRTVPEYFDAFRAAMAVLASGVPIYAGLWYFLHRRHLKAHWGFTVNFLSVFALFAGLAFLLASPLSGLLHPAIITAYLFVTCVVTALSAVALVDLFVIQYYLSSVKSFYISPPLRTVIKLTTFCLVLLPVLRFVLHFNPLTLVAIPTIATAGIALAMQDTLKTFIAGLGLSRIIRLGEWISFQGREGKVIDINWAQTVLETSDGEFVYIPNSLLQTQIVVNYSKRGLRRMSFQVVVSHNASPAQVKDALLRSAQNIPSVASSPAPEADVLSHDEGSSKYVLYYWIQDYGRRFAVQDTLGTRVWNAFRRDGIEIPAPFASATLRRDEKEAERLIPLIQRWAFASAFSAQDLAEIAIDTEERTFLPGETIVKKGDAGDSVFLILAGEAEAFADSLSREPTAILGKDEFFGEMSLLTGAPRNTTVRARGLVQVVEIGDAGLRRVVARDPALAEKLAQRVEKRNSSPAVTAKVSDARSDNATQNSLRLRIRKFFDL